MDNLDDLVTDLLSTNWSSRPTNRLNQFIGALATQFTTPT
jgi:hypothetical protein